MHTDCPKCAETKLKARTRAATRAAVKAGILARKRCADCEANGVINDWPVQAHHEDYTKPLEVIWLCSNHHNRRHSLPRDKHRKIIRAEVRA